MAGDALVAVAALWGAYWLRFDGDFPRLFLSNWKAVTTTLALFNMAIFTLMGLYRRMWRYASVGDLLRIVTASTLAIVGQVLANLMFDIEMTVGVHIIDWLIMLAGVSSLRLAIRIYDEANTAKKGPGRSKRVLIAGAGQAGAMVIREMRRDRQRRYEPVCLVDDNEEKRGMEIGGVRVKGCTEDLLRLVDELGIDEVILAMPSAPKTLVQSLLAECRQLNVPLRVVPGIGQLIDGHVTVSQLRQVQVEDLLGREPVKLDLDQIAGYLRGKRVLVTGAGGSIGSELVRQISRFGPDRIIMLGRGENSIFEIEQEMKSERPQTKVLSVIGDVRDEVLINRLFAEMKPQVVFHAAAHKHVPLMEQWPEEAVKNNVFGTYNVVSAADKHGVERFVLISTDKAVNPVNYMGASKRAAELIIEAFARRGCKTVFSAVRFGNVLGSRGSVVPHFQKQIARGGPVTVTHPEMTRYFMLIPEAVQLVIQAGAMSQGGEVFVLDMGAPVKILDLAENMIRLCGLDPGRDVEIRITGPRPGEKIFEELLTAEEGTRATVHSRIFVANMSVDVNACIAPVRDLFWECIRRQDVRGMVRLLEEHIMVENADANPQAKSGAIEAAAAVGAH